MLRSGTRNEVVLLHVSQAAETQWDCHGPTGTLADREREFSIAGCNFRRRSCGWRFAERTWKSVQGITPRISEGGEGRGNEALEIRGLLKQARVVSAKMHEALGALRATRRQRREK